MSEVSPFPITTRTFPRLAEKEEIRKMFYHMTVLHNQLLTRRVKMSTYDEKFNAIATLVYRI